jgi:surface antigen
MWARGNGATALLLGFIVTLISEFVIPSAVASEPPDSPPTFRNATSAGNHPSVYRTSNLLGHGRTAARRRYHAGGGISCVPFARNDTGIAVFGNAWEWWEKAAGSYARGSVPEPGSVLAFRSNGRMRLGHVAVVTRVINPREVEIEHANWWGPGMRGGVARNVPVVDVSEANDWTAVRVGLGQTGEFGSVYPTYGFIYDRPDTGVMVASNRAPAPQPELNPAPHDLRPAAERGWQTYEEVAEAPVAPRYHRRGATFTTGRTMVIRLHPVSTLPERMQFGRVTTRLHLS